MATIKLYGASDDLIEIEGDVPGCDEHNFYTDGEPVFVVLSTGDVFAVTYGERGVWEVVHTVKTKKVKAKIVKAPKGDDPEPHTDTATISGPVEWVELWEHWPPTDEDVREKVAARLDKVDRSDGMDLYGRLYEALFERPAPNSVEG